MNYLHTIPSLAYSEREGPLMRTIQVITFYCDRISACGTQESFGRKLTNEGALTSMLQSLRILVTVDLIPHQGPSNPVYSLRDAVKLKFLPSQVLQKSTFSLMKSLVRSIGSNLKEFISSCIDNFYNCDTEIMSSEDLVDLDSLDQVNLLEKSSIIALLNVLFVSSVDSTFLSLEYSSYIFDSLISSIANTPSAKLSSTIFQAQQLQLLASLAAAIGDNAIHRAIFPLLRKRSQIYHPIIRDIANVMLKMLSTDFLIPFCSSEWIDLNESTWCENVEVDFLFQNRESIVDAITSSLKEELTIDCIDSINMCLKCWWLRGENYRTFKTNDKFLFVEVVQSLLYSYDRDQRQPWAVICAVLNVFESIFECSTNMFELNCMNQSKCHITPHTGSWKNELLLEFSDNGIGDSDESPKDFFGDYHNSVCDSQEESSTKDLEVVTFCNNLLHRSTFFLSSIDLVIQCRACKVIKKGFQILNCIHQVRF